MSTVTEEALSSRMKGTLRRALVLSTPYYVVLPFMLSQTVGLGDGRARARRPGAQGRPLDASNQTSAPNKNFRGHQVPPSTSPHFPPCAPRDDLAFALGVFSLRSANTVNFDANDFVFTFLVIVVVFPLYPLVSSRVYQQPSSAARAQLLRE